MGDFWGSTLYGVWGAGLTVPGAAVASSGDILLKIGGTLLLLSASVMVYSSAVEGLKDAGLERYAPHKLIYNGLKGLYKRLK